MNTFFWKIAGLSGALAVGLGAFGAHGLKAVLSESSLAVYRTGIDYHFYHTTALLVVGYIYQHHPSRWLRIAGYCFLIGIICFSGSLYLLSTQDVLGVSMRWLGPVTPIGGLFFIVGWIGVLMSRVKG